MADELGSLDGQQIELKNLYLQESFTDIGLGSIQRLTPVTLAGDPDPTRQPVFMASAQVMTPHGPIPVQAEIKADTLRAACDAFPQAIKEAVNDLVEQAKQYERERQGGIVIPRGGRLEMP